MQALQTAFDLRNKKQNKIEKVKILKTPKEALESLEKYAVEGYDSIPDEDKNYFLKCFGIYDKDSLTPKQFMMRVRVPGGQLNQDQALVLGHCAREYGNDYLDITTRMQVELRYLDIENIPTIIEKLHSVGITAYQTGVDNFRNILNDPLDDLGFDNILPSQPLLLKLQEKFLFNHDWISVLPRKFNTSITGSMSNRSNAFGQDCCFVLAQKNGMYGYNLFLGGKVGKIAQNANLFCKDENEVEKLYASLIILFRDFGFRDNRNKNRLHFLIEAVGMNALTSALREHSGINFATAGETMTKLDFTDPDQGKVMLRDRSFAMHVVVPSGVFKGSDLLDAAKASAKYGNGELRFSVEQSLYIMGVKSENLDAILEENIFQNYKNLHSIYHNHLIACAGTEHCTYGVIPNKPDAINMADYLEKTVPMEDGRLRMYWSACVKGCGIHGMGDIGFEGCKAKVDGVNGYGVHISLGGKLTSYGVEGYSVVKGAPLQVAHLYVETLAREYKKHRELEESFEDFHDRILHQYSHAAIGFIMMLQAYLRDKNIDLDIGFEKRVKSGKIEHFEIFDLGRKMYYKLTGNEAYSSVEMFRPLGSVALDPLSKTHPDVDGQLSEIIHKMINPKETQRAEAFSELQDSILLYNLK